MQQCQDRVFGYAVIGAGPSAICAIPSLISKGISFNQIIWIDAGGFQVGAFGTSLSEGSSVPGNTSVASYKKVNNAIYKILPECKPRHNFLFDQLPDDQTCSLSVASEPMQHISDYLRSKISSVKAWVINIDETKNNLKITLKLANNQTKQIAAKKCILCIGATSKNFKFLSVDGNSQSNQNNQNIKDIQIIEDPNIAFIRTRLEKYLKAHPFIKQVAVVGSSHSAALAVMNLLNAGIKVKQFMNKPYKFAETCLDAAGNQYVKHDNTGLKGEVASYIKNLLYGDEVSKKLRDGYQFFISTDRNESKQALLNHIGDCQALVSAIGYETSSTLKINDIPLKNFDYDYFTGRLNDVDNIFGFGIAYPLQVIAPDGEIEFAVGYGKFWAAALGVQLSKSWVAGVIEHA